MSRRVNLALALVVVFAAVGVATEQACDKAAPTEPGAVADAGPSTSDATVDRAWPSDIQVYDVGTVPDAPDGWIIPESIPAKCQIVMSPDQAHMNPPPVWTPCGDGCVEFSKISTDEFTGLRAFLGVSRNGTRYLAFTNWYGPDQPWEIQIIDLGRNAVLLDAMSLRGLRVCSVHVPALTADVALLEIYYELQSPTINRFVMYVSQPIGAPLRRISDQTGSMIPGWWTASSDLWAYSYGLDLNIAWNRLDFSTSMNTAWTSPDLSYVQRMVAVGPTILFDVVGNYLERIYAWDVAGGSRELVGPDATAAGGGCCMATDGTDLAWYQASGLLDGGMFSDVRLMVSPFATTRDQLKPRPLHRSRQPTFAQETQMGGGYLLTVENYYTSYLTVTRLADGAFVTLSAKPGYKWGQPLYIDAEELAVVQYPATGPDAWTKPTSIIRQSLAALGPFLPVDAGQ